MQSQKEDYADIVGAPAGMHGIKYVYPDPEDYAIEEAIEVLKRAEKYRWHDLRENPDDLPEEWYDYSESIIISDYVLIVTEYGYYPEVGYINLASKKWFVKRPIKDLSLPAIDGDVIKWKYIEPCEDEKSVSKDGE